MIAKATPAQWRKIAELKEKIINGITDQPPDDEIRSAVLNMWKRMGHKPKAIIIADCPITACIFFSMLSAQLSAKLRTQLSDQLYAQLHAQLYAQLRTQLSDQLYAQLHAQLHAQLRAQLYDQLSTQLHDQLYDQLSTQLRDQLYAQLSTQLHAQLRTQLHAQLRTQLYAQLHAQLRAQLYDQLSDQLRAQLYTSIWWKAWSGWYKGAEILGVKFESKAMNAFAEWARAVPLIIANHDFPIVSRWPSEVHWRDGKLHNDSGMAVKFRSGWGLWLLNGVAVDEQIVMRPETQTFEQLESDSDEARKRIRIERFGLHKYHMVSDL